MVCGGHTVHLPTLIGATVIVPKGGKVVRCLNLDAKNIQICRFGTTVIMLLISTIIWRSLIFVLDYLDRVRVDVGVGIKALGV